MNLLFAADRGYMEHVMDCISSILRFPSEDGYDIYILHSDLQEDEIQAYAGQLRDPCAALHFRYVNPALFDAFPENPRYPKQIYYRIFAARLLPQTLDRVLYLDGDIIVINPLDELYHMDFNGNYYLACTHVREALNKVNQFRLGMKEEHSYINSGVLLMNLEKLRAGQNEEEVLAFVEKHGRFLALPDQDIITALYGAKTGLLDAMKYNLSDRTLNLYNSDFTHERRNLDWVRKNAVIIHYYGLQKPWKKRYQGKLGIFYRELKAERKKDEGGS